jgi:hypothetical protein
MDQIREITTTNQSISAAMGHDQVRTSFGPISRNC